ncbi:MAG: DUF5010 domain-containing protein [Bacteroidales bacterium]|nr:DUF5010 domain-containing protein [Bacteroidales bacterium]
MKKVYVGITTVVLSLFLAGTLAKSQDLGATFCWHYNEIYGGDSYAYNKSLAKKGLPDDNTHWSVTTEWWENMAEEIEYSGIDFVALLARGTTPDAPDRGNGNPNHISKLVDAMNLTGATFKLCIFDDCPNSWTGAKNWNESGGAVYSTDNPKFDCSVTTNWQYIYDYNIKPTIQAIPDAKRYKIDGRMVIWFWGAKPSWMTNLQGNLSRILTHIKTRCQADFGFTPYLIIEKSWLDNDNTITTAHADGVHGWFTSASQISYSLWKKADGTWWNGQKFGALCPGFGYPGHEPFMDPKMGYPTGNERRLIAGLDATVGAGARSTLVEGFTDAAEAAALWRSGDVQYYDYPNERLNVLRRYTADPYPSTLKIQAEACDALSDLTTGNSGGAYRRGGNLDILKCSDTNGGWYVTATGPNEWMEWKELPLLSNTKFQLRYKSTAASSIKFSVDGTTLGTISLPSTNGAWSTIDAGNYTTGSNSLHTVRLTIVSGSPDINYFKRVNDSSTGIQTLQAEDASYSGAVFSNNQTGYHGDGFIDFQNNANDYIQWTVNRASAGSCELTFRYALPNGGRPLELKVNGVVKVTSLDFPATGDWTTWQTVSTTQSLNAGANTIKLTSIGSNGGNIDELVVTPLGSYLDECEVLTGWSTNGSNTLTLNTSSLMQGTGCVQMIGSGTDEFKKVFSPAYNSGVTAANGVLTFWYYVSDVSKLSNGGQVEISSSGGPDVNEYSWSLLTGLTNGWNEVTLNISDANVIGTPNLSAIDWFRIYHSKSASITTRIDGMQLVNSSLLKGAQIANGIDESDLIEEVKTVNIYPNPYHQGTLYIDLNGFENADHVQVKIFSLAGQLVHEETVLNTGQAKLNLTGRLDESVYLVAIESNESRVVKKLIVR